MKRLVSTLAARSRLNGRSALLALLIALATAFLPAAASAAPPPQLWQTGETGSGAGQTIIPRGIAADPASGHVFVADQSNRRIVEFTARGQFVKAWGWDVVATGPGDDTTPPEDQFEVCLPEDGDVCQQGSTGAGAGQFGSPQGIAVDSAGAVYVVDWGLPSNQRVEKFSAQGDFLLTFGGEVDKTAVALREEQEANSEPLTVTEADENLCTAASGHLCGVGTTGTGQGQFGEWLLGAYIAIDRGGTETTADDKVWVGDQNRIQRFDASGEYQGQVNLPGQTVTSLAVDVAGDLYAIYLNQLDVRKITSSGEELTSPRFRIENPNGNPTSPTAVAVDGSGHVFAFGPTSYGGGFNIDPIFEFDPTGNLLTSFGTFAVGESIGAEFNGSTGLATNLCPGSAAPGNLYVSNASSTKAFIRAYGTDPSGCGFVQSANADSIAETTATVHGTVNPLASEVSECLFEYGLTEPPYEHTAPCAESAAQIGEGSEPVSVHAELSGLSAGAVYHYRLRAANSHGSELGEDATFKTLGPPSLSGETVADVAYASATLKGLVNPEGFPTSYRFEYGTDTSYGNTTPSIGVGSDRTDHAALATLEGLTPGTVYHWRLVATNTAVANGGLTQGPDHTFTTYRQPTPQTDCPNQAFRTGPGAALPDCRAYEMVSPVDKNGGDVRHILGNIATFAGEGVVQTSADGERITYSTGAAFGDIQARLPTNQYLASRDAAAGWSNHALHPTLGNRHVVKETEFGLSREFEAFSPELCDAWFQDNLTPAFTPEGQDDYSNIYRIGLCDSGGDQYEAVTSTELPAGTPGNYINFSLQAIAGYSRDGSHAVFPAQAALTPEAAPNSSLQVYDRFGGGLHLVSVLPDGNADPKQDTVGSALNGNVDNAVSSDGSRVYWTSATNQPGTIGQIYLREHPEQGVVGGECSEPAIACTIPVSSGGNAFFWTAAADGSGAIYGEGEDLFDFDLAAYEAAEPARRLIAHHVLGVLGAADDLSHVYFASTDVLTGAQQNSAGDQAEAGEPNLYLDETGQLTYVATLSGGDVLNGTEPEATAYNVVAREPFRRPARVNPQGTRIAFQSRAPLTGFDNVDPANGKANVEVFTYEAGGALHCVSCNPSGARPDGEELPQPYRQNQGSPTGVFAAAWIPTWEHSLYASHVLSDDGSRLFFNSYEALLPTDTNNAMDVYEWEAPGSGSCRPTSPDYFAQNGGCLYLISSGTSPFESEFWDASPDGRDVFFSTESSLLPQDPGLIDLYDARSGGGFPQPVVPVACEGEACQGPSAAPNDPTPGSATFQGAGNVVEPTTKPCPKGKVSRKGKCVKKVRKHKRHHMRNNHNRRAGR